MSYVWRDYAYNSLTRERMYKPERPNFSDFEHVSEWLPAYHVYLSELKKWEAFIEGLPTDYVWQRPKLIHATEKGIPVSGLRRPGRRKWKNGAGVSASSRVVSHYYADEGDKGRWVRKVVRNRERALWRAEWRAEQWENNPDVDEVTYDTAEWFSSQSLMWDWYEDDYDTSELYTLDYEAFPEFNMPYGYEDHYEYCTTCSGPCEL